MKKWILIVAGSIVVNSCIAQQAIDRHAVVARNDPHNEKADPLSSLSLGNGHFAFTVDVTGLQSFPAYYEKGVPLGTQSEWGWHSFPNTENYKREETLKEYELNGKKITYCVQVKEPERSRKAVDYFRVNPHRLQLGNIGFEITKKDGTLATIDDIKDIDQHLYLDIGQMVSKFTVEGMGVRIVTYAHQQQDGISIHVTSPLLKEKRLSIKLNFPYPTGDFKDVGTFEGDSNRHQTALIKSTEMTGAVRHTLDTTNYFVQYRFNRTVSITERRKHDYIIQPDDNFEASFFFTPVLKKEPIPSMDQTFSSSKHMWQEFWRSGGAIDFSGSTDIRAKELERRIVLSQYLTRIQCASDFPPQETGLTYNSWYGKPHLEMHWWHAVHYALWGRPELMEKSLDWYFNVANGARDIAKRQGFEGLRWQKMTDHDGKEAPSSVGAFLIWQEPHLIYMAELAYRAKKDKKILQKYKDLVFGTATFMASFPTWDSVNKRYNLGKGLIPAQECFDAVKTFNPTYELAYWQWALTVAQQWRERLGMPREKKWDNIIKNLAKWPQANGVYLATESTPDCYTNERYITDHPAVLGAYSTLPACNRLDTTVMKNTYNTILKVWKWETTWGWDFPLMAMTATRLHMPDKALDALFMPVKTNTYLPNGHNYQDDRLTIYLPGNGGLLSAIAMMCAGYDNNKTDNPGFPKDGTWKVKWEGLKPMF
ncbi:MULTISPECIES: glycoside hydrolase family 65 [Niastella]|uniref:Glycoside hydrolase family 65 n=1 Tax=Niastella soli TaxID=2821487 RepID=A0ABS3Z0T7_9BACT|nr:glycoside hydrolase family 65 [Niastella soli]MBO9203779.1 glycoside hydrolase family 65 [Niastella soli]